MAQLVSAGVLYTQGCRFKSYSKDYINQSLIYMKEEWIYRLATTALMYATLVDTLVQGEERDKQWFINWQDDLNKVSVS